MEWDSESDGAGSIGAGEEEQEEEGEERGGKGGGGDTGGAGGMFTFAIEGMLRASGLVVTDALEPDCPIIYVNRGFEEATGYRAEEVLAKIPFPLTQRFRGMLQNGIDLSTVAISYVSSRLWYFLNLFGLRGLFSLILGEENATDDAQKMLQMGRWIWI